ncbi:hypothetical protein FSP39_006930, partial [Pinctada imbricata]
GNLGRVDYITEFEYDLFIRPDTCNPRFRVWFNFTVENVKADQRIIFNIVNFSKTKSLYRDGMSPMVKSTSRPKWYDDRSTRRGFGMRDYSISNTNTFNESSTSIRLQLRERDQRRY